MLKASVTILILHILLFKHVHATTMDNSTISANFLQFNLHILMKIILDCCDAPKEPLERSKIAGKGITKNMLLIKPKFVSFGYLCALFIK